MLPTIARSAAARANTSTLNPVLIIGSGLGGLTLAHSLQKAAIPYRIYEKDTQTSIRAQQGYRIRIHEKGLCALESALPPAVYEAFDRGCGRDRDGAIGGMKRVDAHTGDVGEFPWFQDKAKSADGKPAPEPQAPEEWVSSTADPARAGPGFSLPAERSIMRQALLSGLESPPEYAKAFREYTNTSDGITAHFTDGTTSTRGSLLVGSDGINSRVSRQLLGEQAKPVDLGARMIYGKTPFSTGVLDRIPQDLHLGTRFIFDHSGAQKTLFMESVRFFPRTSHPAAKDYLYWCLVADGATYSLPDAELLGRTGQRALEVAQDMTKTWHASLRPVLELADPEATVVLRMNTSSPAQLPTWESDARVTLLGDAVHCMPPTGGSGANTAVQDAVALAKVLAQGKEQAEKDGMWTAAALGGYEDAMREAVLGSVKMGYGLAVKLLGVKPVEGLSTKLPWEK